MITKPVAWMSPDGKVSETEGKLFYIPLYTAPKPLSDEEIEDYTKAYFNIHPEAKPDVVTYLMCNVNDTWIEYGIYHHSINHKGVIKLTFDGETGELKSAEVLK